MSSDSKSSDKKGFLLLTIKVGQGVWIGDTYISINKIKSKTEISIGIKAPEKIKIDRKRGLE